MEFKYHDIKSSVKPRHNHRHFYQQGVTIRGGLRPPSKLVPNLSSTVWIHKWS